MIDLTQVPVVRTADQRRWERVLAGLVFLRALLCVVTLMFAVAQPATAFGAEQSMIGLTRDEVLASLGKPQSTARRGDTELLVYPKGVRVELRDNQVVNFRGGSEAVIIGSDGTRYIAGENGKVRLADPPAEVASTATQQEEVPSPTVVSPIPAAKPAAAVPAAARTAPASAAMTATTPPAPAKTAPASSATTSPDAKKPSSAPATAAGAVPSVSNDDDSPVPMDEHAAKMRAELEKSVEGLEQGMAPGAAPAAAAPQPRWVGIVSEVVSVVLHYGVVVLILWIALRWVGVSFFWPDLLKVCGLYLVVREFLHGMSELGGYFEFISLFKVDDVVSFIALSVLLFRFKIALSGITALKVAGATKLATYYLMLGIGLALSFGLHAMQ